MKPQIYVETPDGDIVKDPAAMSKGPGKPGEHSDTNDAADNAAGPKANPDPRANANLREADKTDKAEGTGTEITDGEAG